MAVRFPPEDPKGIRRIHVGCGPKHIREDWWNTDIRKFPGIDEVMDATKEWRWRDQIEFVYAEHFLEHLDLKDSIDFLTNAGRALVKGGRIRLSTPGLEWVMRTHFSFASPGDPKHFSDTLAINRAFHGWGHQFLYSRGVLEWLLDSLGYVSVQFFGYGQSDTPVLRDLELHGGFSSRDGYPSVWIIEGERGEAQIAMPADRRETLNEGYLRYVRGGH